MEIRRLIDEDFLALAILNARFYKGLQNPQSDILATANLLADIKTQTDFRAWGLFENNKLLGFVTGYSLSKKSFYFSGLYVIIKLNRNLKKLIQFCLAEVELDYNSWEVDCTNNNITSIMQKFGAAPIYTRYIKTKEA